MTRTPAAADRRRATAVRPAGPACRPGPAHPRVVLIIFGSTVPDRFATVHKEVRDERRTGPHPRRRGRNRTIRTCRPAAAG